MSGVRTDYGLLFTIKKMKKLICTIIGAAVSFSGLEAQEVMTLKACMEYAVENSAKIRLQQADIDDARLARRDAVLEAFTPSISAGTYAYSNFGRSVDPETNTYVSTTSFNNGYQVGGSITLFNGFTAVNNMKISKTALKMGYDREELYRDEICLAVMEAYYNVAYYSELSRILESQVETARRSLELARKQEEIGQKGYADVIEMEAELADREYQKISADNSLDNAVLVLKDLMFWPMDEELAIDMSMVDTEAARILDPSDNVDEIVDFAVINMPSVSIAKAEMDNAKLALKTAKWSFTPQISLNAGWSTSYYTYPGLSGYTPVAFGNQFRNNGGEYIQLSLSFPIFNRLYTFSNLRRKKNAYNRASIQYEQKVREVEAEVMKAVQDRDGASAAFLQADCRSEVQEEAYRLNIRKFEQGLISPIEYQKAADNWLNAKTVRLNSLLTYYIKRSVVEYYNGRSYLQQQ